MVERVATQDAPGGHQAAFNCTVLINGLVAIMRAGWIEAAGTRRKPARQSHLIDPDENQQRPARQCPKIKRQIPQRWLWGIFVLMRYVLGHRYCSRAWNVVRVAEERSRFGVNLPVALAGGRSRSGCNRAAGLGAEGAVLHAADAWRGCAQRLHQSICQPRRQPG